MRSTSQVVLSIGTNLGDRKSNLVDCVIEINEQLENVLQVSHVYETPAWGFKGNPFYNAVLLLETDLNPIELLNVIQKIENQLGKVRIPKSEGYHSRVIDIDIITFGNLVVDLPNLQIPHPHFHKRNFVLQPMLEFDFKWVHPVFKKTVAQLLSDCRDDSPCERIEITFD
ncbi:MAG: 2-amino-4-hydroxy-6-hydroxymethyldihydropteridine diphosphokinase [Flavobacteriales bacterium]|nr:2-amino-4-hydroxy-6-hydroxymethyldihydropteridine diphosphokinase [Flavobacteriales bacterium]